MRYAWEFVQIKTRVSHDIDIQKTLVQGLKKLCSRRTHSFCFLVDVWCVTLRRYPWNAFSVSVTPVRTRLSSSRAQVTVLQPRAQHWPLDTLPTLIWKIGKEGCISYGNKTFQELFKRLQLTTPQERERFERPVNKLAQATRKNLGHGRLSLSFTLNGKKQILEVVSFLDHEQQVWFWAEDLSNKMLDIQDAHKRARCVNRLLKHLPIGVAIFDRKQRLTSFNTHFLGLFQPCEEWLEQKPSWEDMLDDFRARRLLPEVADFASYKKKFSSFFESLDRTPHEEFLHLANEGTVRMLISAHPFEGCVVLFEDITEKAHLRRELTNMRKLLTSTAHYSDEGMVIVNASGHVMSINKAFEKLWELKGDASGYKDMRAQNLFDTLSPSLYTHTHRAFYKKKLGQILEERCPQVGYVLYDKKKIFKISYAPLANGNHLFKSMDVTFQFERQELKAETHRLLAVERLILFARIALFSKSINRRIVYEDTERKNEAVQEKWLSVRFLKESFAEFQKTFQYDRSILRDRFLLADSIDEILSLFDAYITEKHIKLQIQGFLDVQLLLNRNMFTQFLSHAFGYALHEAAPESLVTLTLHKGQEGLELHIVTRVNTQEHHQTLPGIPRDLFRPWFLSLSMLEKLASITSSTVIAKTCRKDHFHVSCLLSKQAIEHTHTTNFPSFPTAKVANERWVY